MKHNAAILIAGAVASGLVSVAISFASPFTLVLHPGVFFAFFVAAPWVRMSGGATGTTLATSLLCIVGYGVAYQIAGHEEMLAAPVGAGLGTFIMLVPAIFLDTATSRRACFAAVATGTLAAAVFPACVALMTDPWWGLLPGIAFWQVAVAAALATGLRDVRTEATPEEAESPDW